MCVDVVNVLLLVRGRWFFLDPGRSSHASRPHSCLAIFCFWCSFEVGQGSASQARDVLQTPWLALQARVVGWLANHWVHNLQNLAAAS